MNTRRNLKGMLIVFCAMFVALCVYLVYIVNAYGMRWFTSPYNTRLDAKKSNVVAGAILDSSGKALVSSDKEGKRVYIDDSSIRRATAHVVGDDKGQTLGAESFFSKYLLGFDQNIFDRVTQAIAGEKTYGSNIRLTIDSALSDTAYHALGDKNGAVVVLNYKTGEILASVSKPTFDPKYMQEYLDGKRELDDGALVNRVNSGKYTPGSVFKIITATAALRYLPGVTERTFTCDGPLAFDAKSGKYLPDVHITAKQDAENKKTSGAGMSGEYKVVRDYNGEYHGELDLKTAFQKSCNHVFAQLAVEIGADKLYKTARDLGVGEDFIFTDIVTAMSTFEKADSDVDTAWSGVGQYKDIMTPLHMCMIVSAIANGGVVVEPKLLKDVISVTGVSTYTYTKNTYKTMFTKAESALLKEYMIAVVEKGTGRNAKVSGVTVAGKTGTAEVGSGDDKPNAWFVGFVEDDEHPLAVCVVVEKGGSGGSNAAPIAGTVLKKAIALGY
ncbi:hypothetical protein LJC27_07345 [Christensenellaceae bacterium OttesenSCG-928-M15]|nr:hypothetical protein [Christensenellaceae bacterium OttesenSCG-928-M15]